MTSVVSAALNNAVSAQNGHDSNGAAIIVRPLKATRSYRGRETHIGLWARHPGCSQRWVIELVQIPGEGHSFLGRLAVLGAIGGQILRVSVRWWIRVEEGLL